MSDRKGLNSDIRSQIYHSQFLEVKDFLAKIKELFEYEVKVTELIYDAIRGRTVNLLRCECGVEELLEWRDAIARISALAISVHIAEFDLLSLRMQVIHDQIRDYIQQLNVYSPRKLMEMPFYKKVLDYLAYQNHLIEKEFLISEICVTSGNGNAILAILRANRLIKVFEKNNVTFVEITDSGKKLLGKI